jgi:glycine betaine/proline transport system ATP-binding protein
MQKEILRVEDLTVIFGPAPEKQALPLLREGKSKAEIQEQTGHIVGVAGASFSVRKGDLFVVMGLSGSGKSTLIRCINRLITPTSGHVYVEDEDVVQMDKERLRELRRTRLSMVFQQFNLFEHKSVWENTAFGLKIQGVDKDEQYRRSLETLEIVGLKPWAEQSLSSLSGGMQQRVGLARALATDADILLMDEAFGALDPLIRREMQDELLDIQEKFHKTIIFITHDLNEALRVGDHVAIMKDGEIVQIGSPIDIITHPDDEYVAAFIQDVDQARVITAAAVMDTPPTVTEGPELLQKAMQTFEQNKQEDRLYIVDAQQQPQGLLYKDDVLEAANNGNVQLEQYIRQDFARAAPDSILADLYAPGAHNPAIAVVDEQGRLQGSLNARTILANLGHIQEIGSIDENSEEETHE